MRRYIAIIAMSVALFLPHASSAAESSTSSIESLGPFGGNSWDVAVDPVNNMVYTTAKDSPNGFYRSSDAGASWSGLASGVDYGGGVAVEVNQTNGDVYAIFNEGTYKSTNTGRTFTKISDAASTGFLVAGGKVLVGATNNTGGVVQVSSDDGATFTSRTFSSNAQEIIWDIDYSADTGAYFIYSKDQSTSQNHLYRSTDGAVSWSEITLPTELNTVSESRFAVSPIDDQIMVVTGGNNVNAYMSTNGGTTWADAGARSSGVTIDQLGRIWMAEQYRDTGDSSWTSFDDDNTSSALGGHNVTVDPENSSILYADGMPGLSKSSDRGATWADINNGIKGITISDISQATDKNIVWAAAYNGIAKTSNFRDANPTWQFPVLEEPGFGIWTDPANPNVAVAGVSSGTRRTTDGGVTWSEYGGTNITESYQVFDEIINDVADTSILYAAISNNDPGSPKNGAVAKSTDQGVSWTNLNLPDNGSAQSITQAPNGDLYVGLGAESNISGENGIYKYSDSTWTKLSSAPDQDIVKIIADPEDSNTVYAVAGLLYNNGSEDSFGFYKTTDAGATWTHVTSGLSRLRNFTSLAIQTSTSPNTLYIGAENTTGQGVLLKSSDAGNSWGTLYTGLKNDTFYTLLFDGVTIGSSRGLFDAKSKASLKMARSIKKPTVGKKIKLTATVKDATTGKILKKKTVKVYEKISSKKRKLIKTVKTDKKGKFSLTITPKKAKKYQYYAEWKPGNSDKEEYATSKSTTMVFTVKKK